MAYGSFTDVALSVIKTNPQRQQPQAQSSSTVVRAADGKGDEKTSVPAVEEKGNITSQYHLAQISGKKHYKAALECKFVTEEDITKMCQEYSARSFRWRALNVMLPIDVDSTYEYVKLRAFLGEKNTAGIIKSGIKWDQIKLLDRDTMHDFCRYCGSKDFRENFLKLRVNSNENRFITADKIQYAVERFESKLEKNLAAAAKPPSQTHG